MADLSKHHYIQGKQISGGNETFVEGISLNNSFFHFSLPEIAFVKNEKKWLMNDRLLTSF